MGESKIPLFELSEVDLIAFLISSPNSFFNCFGFGLSVAVGWHSAGWSFDCYLSLESSKLGFDVSQKPGDIDVLFVPRFDGDLFPERSVAIEVKRVPIPVFNRGKSPSSYGSRQLRGLCEMGFPFAGLLIVPLVRPLPKTKWSRIPILKSKYRVGENKYDGDVLVDFSNVLVADRFVGRMQGLKLPDYAGYNIASISLAGSENHIAGISVAHQRYAQKNPRVSDETINEIRQIKCTPDYRITQGTGSLEIHSLKFR